MSEPENLLDVAVSRLRICVEHPDPSNGPPMRRKDVRRVLDALDTAQQRLKDAQQVAVAERDNAEKLEALLAAEQERRARLEGVLVAAETRERELRQAFVDLGNKVARAISEATRETYRQGHSDGVIDAAIATGEGVPSGYEPQQHAGRSVEGIAGRAARLLDGEGGSDG